MMHVHKENLERIKNKLFDNTATGKDESKMLLAKRRNILDLAIVVPIGRGEPNGSSGCMCCI